MSEQCFHTRCEYGRADYCEVEAADPNGDVAVVTDAIDDVIYRRAAAQTNGRIQMITRVVPLVLPHPEFEYAEALDVHVTLTHQMNKELQSEHYGVEVCWRTTDETAEGCFRTMYFMDLFLGGRVLTLVDEPDIITGGRVERPMTPYDYKQIFDELERIADPRLTEPV